MKKKKWSTRKKTLYFGMICVMLYTIADMILTFLYAYTGTQMFFDPTLTTEFFGYMKLISGLGGGLSAADIIADTVTAVATHKNKNDDDEGESLG